jgi:hypothetical protein
MTYAVKVVGQSSSHETVQGGSLESPSTVENQELGEGSLESPLTVENQELGEGNQEFGGQRQALEEETQVWQGGSTGLEEGILGLEEGSQQ